MYDTWESWVSDKSVEEFLQEVDEAVAEGLFPDRRAAFVDYAESALAQLAFAHWGPSAPDDSISAEKLADQLFAFALEVEKRARRSKGCSVKEGGAAGLKPTARRIRN